MRLIGDSSFTYLFLFKSPLTPLLQSFPHMPVHRERFPIARILLQVMQRSLGEPHLLPLGIRNCENLPAHLIGVLPFDLVGRCCEVEFPFLSGKVVRQFPGLEEDDVTPRGFFPLILDHLVEPAVDFLGNFARASRPEPEVVVLGPDEVTFRHSLTFDERDHREIHQEPEGLLQVVGEAVLPLLHLMEEADVCV